MRRFLCFFVGCVAFASQAFSSDPVTVFRVSPKSPSFLVRLPANATTGFRWYLVNKPSWLQIVDARYVISANARIGQGGTSEWEVRWPESHCVFPRRAEIVFAYARPWVGASSNEKQTHITVYCSPIDKVKTSHSSQAVDAEVM